MGQGTIIQHNLGQRVECGECEKFIQIVGNYETLCITVTNIIASKITHA